VGQELTALSMLAGDLADASRTDPATSDTLIERMSRGIHRCQQQLRVVMRGLLPVPVDRDGLMAALADLAERTRQDSNVACEFDCAEPVAVTVTVRSPRVTLAVT